MRILFAGTPETAVPSLRALLDSSHEVIGVLTRPDAPSGRGRHLHPSPVRRLAEDAGLEVLTPSSLRSTSVQQQLRVAAPDAVAVVAYGNLVPPQALRIPPHGWINLHFSLLPHWRGAAPAQRSVLAGETSTGMSTFLIEEGLDTGPVLAQEEMTIGAYETSGELLERMAEQGTGLLVRSMDALADGSATFTPQADDDATHAAKLTTSEARISWDRSPAEVCAHIRGMSPDPGAWTVVHGARMKVLGLEEPHLPDEMDALAPGQLLATRRQLLVGTAGGPLALAVVAPAGKKPMRATDWARGAQLGTHTVLDAAEEEHA